MTKQEFCKKYENVELYFKSYYKYKFLFEGRAGRGKDNKLITIVVGGTSEDIYRLDVEAKTSYNIYDLDPYEGQAAYTDRNVSDLEGFYERTEKTKI
jgi:hypothetical protein